MAVTSAVGDGPSARNRSKAKVENIDLQHFNTSDCGRRSILGINNEENPALIAEINEIQEIYAFIVESACDMMSQEAKTIFHEVCIKGKSQAQVSRELKIPTLTVNDVLKKSVKKICKMLEKYTKE